jgi:FkbM family methyltransferase
VRPAKKPESGLALHWWRVKRSLGRRWLEWRLPHGFERLGTRYGGWWLFAPAVSSEPLLVDCGLGKDISFPLAFLERFGGRVIGLDPNPVALDYCRAHCPAAMEVRGEAFWTEPGRQITFHMPRPADDLPPGADGVSGSVLVSHAYASGSTLEVATTSLTGVLSHAGRPECDMLKLDIEGAEYDVIDALCANGDVRRTRQLAVEFHHGWTARTLQDTDARVARLDASGFTLRHVEGRNYLFLRREG